MHGSDFTDRQRFAIHLKATVLTALVVSAIVVVVGWSGLIEFKAIDAQGREAMGNKFASRLITALRTGDDAEFGESGDRDSAARFRKTRLELRAQIGAPETVLFLAMPELTLGTPGGPDSVIRAEFLIRGERGQRTVRLARSRDVAKGEWRVTPFEIANPDKPPVTYSEGR